MSLAISITKTAVAAKASTITLVDATGAYHASTNTGGYGSENELLSPATTGLAFIMWRYWTDTSYSLPDKLTTDDITAIQGSGLAVSLYDVGLSTDDDDVFSDGIHQVKYVPAQLLPNSATATFTPGSKVVSLTNGQDIADLLAAGALVWIGIDIDDQVYFYEVDTAGTNNDTVLAIKTAFAASDEEVTGPGIAGADGDIKILINKAAEACIVSSIGKLTDIPGSCPDVEKTLNKMIRWRFAADVQHDCLDYDGAHNLLVSINKYCESGKCTCSI